MGISGWKYSNRRAVAAIFWKPAFVVLWFFCPFCCTTFFGSGFVPGPVSSFEPIAFVPVVRFQAAFQRDTSRYRRLVISREATTTMATVLCCELPGIINSFGAADKKEEFPPQISIQEFETTNNEIYAVEEKGCFMTEEESSTTKASAETIKQKDFVSSSLREPLRFNFTGYSIW
jgi:hypothetical protein